MCVHGGHFRGNKAEFWLWNVCWDWMQGCLPPAGGSEPPHGFTLGVPCEPMLDADLVSIFFMLLQGRGVGAGQGTGARAWGRGVGCWVWVWRPRSLLALAE